MYLPKCTLWRASSGEAVTILGAPLGQAVPVRAALRAKVEGEHAKLVALQKTPHQVALLLLRFCHAPRLNHLARIVPPAVAFPVFNAWDEAVLNALAPLAGLPVVSPLQAGLAHQPLAKGRLGLPHLAGMAEAAFSSSLAFAAASFAEANSPLTLSPLSQDLVGTAIHALELPEDGGLPSPSSIVKAQSIQAEIIHDSALAALKITMTRLEAQQFMETSLPTAHAFLTAIPCHPSLQLNNAQIAQSLRHRLLVPACPLPFSFCLACSRPAHHPSHALSCHNVSGPRIGRHDAIVLALAKACRQSDVQATVEETIVPGCRADLVLAQGPKGVTAVDVTVRTWPSNDPAPHGRSNPFAAAKADKERSYRPAIESGVVDGLITFAVTAGGALSPDAMSLLRWLGQRGEAEASEGSTLAWRLAQDVAIVALKCSYYCLSTWHLRHRAAAEAGAGLTRVMVDEDNETVGI